MRQKREAAAVLTSIVVHFLILTALFMVQYAVVQQVGFDIQTVVEDEELQREMLEQLLNDDPKVSVSLAIIPSERPTNPKREGKFLKEIIPFKLPISEFEFEIPRPPDNEPFEKIPYGAIKGDGGVVVEGYPVAMSRLTSELRQLIQGGERLLVVWLFDASDSMRNDQEQIRDKFHKVNVELRLDEQQDKGVAKGKEVILTAVHSYGKGITDLTGKPTADEHTIKKAIDNIKIDDTGEENMCAAISTVIDKYSSKANSGRRQLVLVIVSDESGDDGETLDLTLKKVKAARSRCYILGRESIFGYPYAQVQWKDPQFGLNHWLQIRRGPETAYPEALQYDGLHGRWDAQSAGFGPYEQVRLAEESGGIFFILPSEDENLVTAQHGDERKFRFEALREYAPDLVPRNQYVEERDSSDFRRTIWDVVVKLNPHRDKELYIREHWYQGDEEGFRKEAKTYFGRALRAMGMLNEANKMLDGIKDLRDKETSQRWKANYDLAAAQVLAYRVRLFQYLLAMDKHAKNYPEPKDPKSNRWNLRRTQKMLPPDEEQVKITKVDMDEFYEQLTLAEDRLRQVAFKHPQTPWAYRAKYELDQGFGMEFYETFRDPRIDEPSIEPPKQ